MSIVVINNRSDIGAGTRGSDLGIRAMEIAALNNGSNFFKDNNQIELTTEQQSIYAPVETPKAKRIEHIVKQCNKVCDEVANQLDNEKFPLVISGDHSSAVGTVTGVKKANPEAKVGVVWIDAHADLHSPFTTPSGNVHGMPLAALCNVDNLDCKINEPNFETINQWENFKNLANISNAIDINNIVFFGVRDTEEPEDKLIEQYGIKNFSVAEVRFKGIQKCLKEALSILEECDILYISFDVDSLDCDLISYGTGTPVAKGFDSQEAIEIINGFLSTEKVACLEFVEVNPTLDNKCNKMAETAFTVLEQITPNISHITYNMLV